MMVQIASKTKNVAVYERLRQDIVKGKLKPGQKIVMRELAKELGLSETPIREAIRRLESEGYLRFTPHMGALVSELDEQELVEIFLIRIELEALATRLAAPSLTDKDIDFLKRKNCEMETTRQKGTYETTCYCRRYYPACRSPIQLIRYLIQLVSTAAPQSQTKHYSNRMLNNIYIADNNHT